MNEILNEVKFKTKSLGTVQKKDWNNQHVNAYRITIKRAKKGIVFSFFQGMGITESPTLSGVLECLTSDYQTVKNTTLEDFANDMGYEDIDEATRIYNSVLRQNDRLEKIFTTKEIAILTDNLNK